MIRHLVALRFAGGTGVAERQAIYDDLAALGGHLEGMLGFRSFKNISPETVVVRGFTEGFWVDFRDAAARDAYLADAAHRAVGARIVAACEGGVDGVFVCDMEV